MVLEMPSSFGPRSVWKMFDSYSTRSETKGVILKPGKPRSGQIALRSAAAASDGSSASSPSRNRTARTRRDTLVPPRLMPTPIPQPRPRSQRSGCQAGAGQIPRMIGDDHLECQSGKLLGPLDHPTGGVLRICVPDPFRDLDLERIPVLLVDLGRSVLRVPGAAHVAPTVGLERAADRGGETLRLQPSAVHEAHGLDVGRLDDGGIIRAVVEPLRDRDVLELRADRTLGRARARPEQKRRGDGDGKSSTCHAEILARGPGGHQANPASHESRIRRAKSASTAVATSRICAGVRSSSSRRTTIARPRFVRRPTCMEAMLTLRRPRMEPMRPTMPGRSSYEITSTKPSGVNSMLRSRMRTTRGWPSKTVPAIVLRPPVVSVATSSTL